MTTLAPGGRIAFDIVLMRPGCPLVQIGMGCDPRVAHNFPCETWLLAPTEAMRVYAVSDLQIPVLVDKVVTHWRRHGEEATAA